VARRKDHSRKELAELVIGTATQIIADEGLQGLTTRKIATKIGYSAGTIYNVFDNLDAVVSCVNTQTMRSLNKAILKIKLSGEVMSDARLILFAYLEFQEKQPRLWAAIIKHSSREDLELPDHYVSELETAFQRVEQVLAPLFKDQVDNSVKIAVRVLWASLQGISSLPPNARMISTEGESKVALSVNLIETYLRGVQASYRSDAK